MKIKLSAIILAAIFTMMFAASVSALSVTSVAQINGTSFSIPNPSGNVFFGRSIPHGEAYPMWVRNVTVSLDYKDAFTDPKTGRTIFQISLAEYPELFEGATMYVFSIFSPKDAWNNPEKYVPLGKAEVTRALGNDMVVYIANCGKMLGSENDCIEQFNWIVRLPKLNNVIGYAGVDVPISAEMVELETKYLPDGSPFRTGLSTSTYGVRAVLLDNEGKERREDCRWLATQVSNDGQFAHVHPVTAMRAYGNAVKPAMQWYNGTGVTNICPFFSKY